MKATLVATIGTRDLMFQVSSGTWYNIGDDRMQDGDIIGEQAEVISDLSFGTLTYRDLTKYLLDQFEIYRDRIKPAIIGKLIIEKADDIEKIYLIATNQNAEVPEREKDTIHAAELIKAWVIHQFKHVSVKDVEVITLGADGTNPSNFEQMFYWWRNTWRQKIPMTSEQLWVCLKGGVGQTSEASRISGLSFYGDRIQFFEFKQNTKANRQGIPSDYSGPFLGTNYLWDRTQQQALKLLDRYDYAEVYDLLQPYFQQDSVGFSSLPNLIKAGIAWNQGDFNKFFSLAKSSLTTIEQKQGTRWWWMAYEQIQLGVVRLNQQNTTEAMLHSYRSVEGALYGWAKASFPNDVQETPNQYLLLSQSILFQYPSLKSSFFGPQEKQLSEVKLTWWVWQELLAIAIPQAAASRDFKPFFSTARELRNKLSHHLGGVGEKEIFKAWGDVKNSEQWQRRILNCLNLVTEQKFTSLSQVSLFSKTHLKVVQAIENYELTP
jgi:hypothetical protein